MLLSNSLLESFAVGVSNMIAKLAKTCTLRISPDKLNFILSDKVANGGVSMWCELEQVSGGSLRPANRPHPRPPRMPPERAQMSPLFLPLGELLQRISNGRCLRRKQCDLFRANIGKFISSLENCPECPSLENQAD